MKFLPMSKPQQRLFLTALAALTLLTLANFAYYNLVKQVPRQWIWLTSVLSHIEHLWPMALFTVTAAVIPVGKPWPNRLVVLLAGFLAGLLWTVFITAIAYLWLGLGVYKDTDTTWQEALAPVWTDPQLYLTGILGWLLGWWAIKIGRMRS